MANDQASRPTPYPVAALAGLLASIVVALVVMAFVWPAATSQARNLPVGISGPAESVDQLEENLADQDPAPYVLHEVSSRDDAAERIENRELYGAILLPGADSDDAPEILLATAASPAAANALRGVATELQERIDQQVIAALTSQLTTIGEGLAAGQAPERPSGGTADVPEVTVTDLVPLADGDRTGAGLAAAVFPLVLGGLAGGIILVFLVRGVPRRLVGLAAYGVGAGLLIVTILQSWFQIIQGPWLVNAAVAGLAVTATAALVVGLHSLIGAAGIGVAAVITMFIGNPIAGASAPPQFLPEPWGAIGQGFVPGASATLLRSTGYFPDAPTGSGWLTLVTWLVAGLVLALIGRTRQGRRSQAADVPAGRRDR
ncbi:ABC transporter permease [Microbacterium sp. HJ5]